MIISSDAVDGHLPSPPSNPSSSLPSMAIPSSDVTLDGRLLSDSANLQVQGDLGFESELSNSNTTSSGKVVSTDPDGNCSDPIAKLEDQLMEEVLPLHDQSLDDTPIGTRDYDLAVSSDGWESLQDELLANLSVEPAETPILGEGDKDECKSDMEIEPKRKPSRSFRNWPGWFANSSHGLESEFYPEVSDSWDFSRERWGYGPYGQDDRPSSFSHPAETGVGAGLDNLGNTCFLNAILQCFTHTVPLVKALRSLDHLLPCQRGLEGFCVVCALRNHVERSLASSGKIISPSQIVDNLNKISSCFHRYQQEDAHEFLQCLLDKLERCCLISTLEEEELSSPDDNIVQQVFGGRLLSKLRCCNCGHCSDKYEPLIDLSLEIEDAETLHHALESFTKVEKIEDCEAKLKCDNCKEEVSMEKQLLLDRTPSVAALHLKRFKTDGSSIEKIGKHVDFPLELDLVPYSNGKKDSCDAQEHLKYQLYAVVVHNGISPTSGHYFCYVRSSPSIWHKLDDSMVVSVEKERVLSEAAYILFYVRENTPWFSSLMESQKGTNTSPKSVLDRVESAYPHVENSGVCKTVVNESHNDRTPLRRVPMVEDDNMNQNGDEITGQIKNTVAESCCDKSRVDDKLGVPPSEEVNTGEFVHKIQRNDAVDPLVPPSSLIPEIYVKPQPESRHKTWQNHLKVENCINEKKLKRNREDNERKEAARYIHKNVSSSRGMKLLAAMAPRNDKKRRFRMSPCKQGSPPGSRSKLIRHQQILH